MCYLSTEIPNGKRHETAGFYLCVSRTTLHNGSRRNYLFLKEIVKYKIVCQWVLGSNQLESEILQPCVMWFYSNKNINESFVGQQERKIFGDYLFQKEIINGREAVGLGYTRVCEKEWHFYSLGRDEYRICHRRRLCAARSDGDKIVGTGASGKEVEYSRVGLGDE